MSETESMKQRGINAKGRSTLESASFVPGELTKEVDADVKRPHDEGTRDGADADSTDYSPSTDSALIVDIEASSASRPATERWMKLVAGTELEGTVSFEGRMRCFDCGEAMSFLKDDSLPSAGTAHYVVSCANCAEIGAESESESIDIPVMAEPIMGKPELVAGGALSDSQIHPGAVPHSDIMAMMHFTPDVCSPVPGLQSPPMVESRSFTATISEPLSPFTIFGHSKGLDQTRALGIGKKQKSEEKTSDLDTAFDWSAIALSTTDAHTAAGGGPVHTSGISEELLPEGANKSPVGDESGLWEDAEHKAEDLCVPGEEHSEAAVTLADMLGVDLRHLPSELTQELLPLFLECAKNWCEDCEKPLAFTPFIPLLLNTLIPSRSTECMQLAAHWLSFAACCHPLHKALFDNDVLECVLAILHPRFDNRTRKFGLSALISLTSIKSDDFAEKRQEVGDFFKNTDNLAVVVKCAIFKKARCSEENEMVVVCYALQVLRNLAIAFPELKDECICSGAVHFAYKRLYDAFEDVSATGKRLRDSCKAFLSTVTGNEYAATKGMAQALHCILGSADVESIVPLPAEDISVVFVRMLPYTRTAPSTDQFVSHYYDFIEGAVYANDRVTMDKWKETLGGGIVPETEEKEFGSRVPTAPMTLSAFDTMASNYSAEDVFRWLITVLNKTKKCNVEFVANWKECRVDGRVYDKEYASDATFYAALYRRNEEHKAEYGCEDDDGYTTLFEMRRVGGDRSPFAELDLEVFAELELRGLLYASASFRIEAGQLEMQRNESMAAMFPESHLQMAKMFETSEECLGVDVMLSDATWDSLASAGSMLDDDDEVLDWLSDDKPLSILRKVDLWMETLCSARPWIDVAKEASTELLIAVQSDDANGEAVKKHLRERYGADLASILLHRIYGTMDSEENDDQCYYASGLPLTPVVTDETRSSERKVLKTRDVTRIQSTLSIICCVLKSTTPHMTLNSGDKATLSEVRDIWCEDRIEDGFVVQKCKRICDLCDELV